MNRKKMTGNLLLLFTAMIWGTSFVFQRVGMDSIGPMTFTASRMVLSAIAVGAVAYLPDIFKKNTSARADTAELRAYKRNTLVGGVICGLFLAGGSLLQQIGVVYTTAGKAGFITAMYMLLVPVVNFLLFKKKNSLRVWLAVLVGVAGMYLLCVKEGFTLTRGDILISLCAFMFCGHILCCDRYAPVADAVKISAIQFAVCALICLGFAFAMEQPAIEQLRSAIVPILYCGLISGGLGFTLQIVAQKFTDPTVASLLMSLESVFAAIAGALLLSERMSLRELLGCVIMFAAIVLVQLPEKKRSV